MTASLKPDKRQWRPIETVPKDQTKVLLWSVGYQFDMPGYYIGHYEYLGYKFVPVIGCTFYSTTAEQFTHWLPLPEPPQ